MASNKRLSLSEDSSLTSLRQPQVPQFNRQMKLRITAVAVRGVAMTTNNVTNIHKENMSSGFELWGEPYRWKSVPSNHFFPNLAIITVGYVQRGLCPSQSTKKSIYCPRKGWSMMRMKPGLNSLFSLFNCIHYLSLSKNNSVEFNTDPVQVFLSPPSPASFSCNLFMRS